MSSLLLRGFLLGFAVAASPGRIFVLCLRVHTAALLRGRLTPALISAISTCSGLAIATLGMLAIYSAFS